MVEKFSQYLLPYEEYRNRVDAFYREKNENYRELLDAIVCNKNAKDFYDAIFYIIKSFLDDESDNNQLFIQLPSDELGYKDTEHQANFSCLQHIAAEALLLATTDKLLQNECPQSLQECELGSIVFMGSKVLNPADGNSRERVWKVVESRNYNKKRLTELLSDIKKFSTSEAEKAYEENKGFTFRLKSDVDLPETPTRKSKFLQKLGELAKKILTFKQLKNKIQFSNALLVCYDDIWNDTILDSSLIDSPVKIAKRYDTINEDFDLVIFIGDNKYRYFKDRIQEKLAYGDLCKVVFIGSNIYDGFEEQANAVKYSFSFREMYSYFNGMNRDDRCVFPYVKIHSLSFPWLNETLEILNEELLKCTALSQEERSNILSYSIYPFLGIEIQRDIEKTAEKLREFIYENISMPYEDVESYISLYSSIVFPDTTPKINTIQSLAIKHKQDSTVTIHNHKSFKNEIKDFIRTKKNRYSNRIFIDVKGDWRAYVDILKYLLRKGLVGHFYFISYCQLDMIRKFLNEEYKIYNAKYRKQLLGGLSLNEPKAEPIINVDGDLGSFYKPIEIDDYFNARNNSPQRSSSAFELTDIQGNVILTTGDVIYESTTVSLQTIFDNVDDYLPATITYYEKPDNFQLLMKLKYSFHPDRDIDYYAQLWRNVLKSYCDDKYEGKFKALERAEFPYLKNLKSYYSTRVTTKFPLQINPMVRKLLSLNLITREDARYILAANRANQQNSQNGMELKEALYDYKLTGHKRKILLDIENASQRNSYKIDAQSILDASLKSIDVVDISKTIQTI